MNVDDIMTELAAMGSDSIKKILLKHGIKEPLFGVKVEQLKTIQKKVKKDYKLSKELYRTGNADAMYLAGLIADDEQMTREDLQDWVKLALSSNISEYTVPWVAAGGKYGFELGLQWIDDKQEHIAAAGWATLAGWVAMKPDDGLDIPVIKGLLARIERTIHNAANRERHTMNGFITAVGTYVKELTGAAIETAHKTTILTVGMKLPDAATYIGKAAGKGQLGKKKKTIKC